MIGRMDYNVRMAWTMLGLWVLAHATSGCSNGTASLSDAAAVSDVATAVLDVATLTPGEKLHCEPPGCCVPVDVDPDAITVYRSGGSIGIDIILALPSVSANAWAASLEASLSWGQSAACTTRIWEGYSTLVAVSCLSVPLDGAPACDSTATLTLLLGTSTYTDATGTQILCSGTPDVRVEIPVALVCPKCPYNPATNEPCNLPDKICYYSASDSTGATHNLPCWCYVNSDRGDRRWSCAIP